MKKVILILTLILITAQAHGFGWFLLGVAIGSDSSHPSPAMVKTSHSPKYLEVHRMGCDDLTGRYEEYAKNQLMIKSSYVISFYEPNKNKEKCTEVRTTMGNYHIKAPYKEVMKKLFKGKK